MASPQTENGYIRIANELWDAVLQRDFSKRQQQILFFIWRLSYGCQKKNAYVPKMRLFELCGVAESKIKDELLYLEKSRVLIWDREDQLFEINKNHDEWFCSLSKSFDELKFIDLIAQNIARKTSQNSKENFPKRETKLAEKGSEIIVTNEDTSQNGKHELPKMGNSTPFEPNQDKASELSKDIIKDIVEEEDYMTALDAYTFSFGKIAYTGHIQGYVLELMQRGYPDTFIRDVFLEMGANGVTDPNLKYMKKLAEDWIARGINSKREAELLKASSKAVPSKVTPFPQRGKADDLRRRAKEAMELEQG